MNTYLLIQDNKIINKLALESQEAIDYQINVNGYEVVLESEYTGTIEVPLQPVIKITSITSDNGNSIIDDFIDITIPVGTTITINGQIESNIDQSILPITKFFRLPIKSTDGREVVTLLSINNGTFFHSFKFDQSGIWNITREAINSRLPEEEKMLFNNLEIFVVQ
jgi:hypothetical protein